MPRVVITGAAGFIGSHLSETLLDRGYVGHRHRQPADRATRQNIAHLRNRDFSSSSTTSRTTSTSRAPVDLRAALGEPGQPDRLSRAADPDAEGRRARHAQRARAGQGEEGARFVHRLDVGGLRRSARAPAEGNLLGQRQPHRPARRVRRGQALRRGDHDGVSPVPRRWTRRSCASSTPMDRACVFTTAAPCRRS